jgi:hypothetical protein
MEWKVLCPLGLALENVTVELTIKRHHEQVQWFQRQQHQGFLSSRALRQATNRACIVSVFNGQTWFSCRGLTFRPWGLYIFVHGLLAGPAQHPDALRRREVVYKSVHFSKRERGTGSGKTNEDSASAFPSWPPSTTLPLSRRTVHHEYTLG